MAEVWFDTAFLRQTQLYVDKKISLNEYKCWLFPNAWYLEFEEDHPVHDARLLLAEYSGQDLHDFTMSESELCVALKERITQPWRLCRECKELMQSVEGCWLCESCGNAEG